MTFDLHTPKSNLGCILIVGDEMKRNELDRLCSRCKQTIVLQTFRLQTASLHLTMWTERCAAHIYTACEGSVHSPVRYCSVWEAALLLAGAAGQSLTFPPEAAGRNADVAGARGKSHYDHSVRTRRGER